MNNLEDILYTLERTVNTNRKRHSVGGILMSISLLFCGLTLTVMTLKTEDNTDAQYIE